MPKKKPMRRCCGCMEMKPKADLIRVVRSKEGDVSLDLAGKAPGRGAYVCRDPECLRKARKARRFEREFSCAVSDDVYDRMEAELEKYEPEVP